MLEVEFFGANCLRISFKKTVFVIDDNLSDLGGKSITKADDVSLQTDISIPVAAGARLLLDCPGEYEVGDVSVTAIAARNHRDEEGKTTSTIFKLYVQDTNVVIVGHIHPNLDETQLELIGECDVLIVPVGGNGFTLDPTGALQVVKAIQPSVVIPTSYQMSGLKAPMPQVSLEEAVKQLAMPASEPVKSFKLKPAELEADQTRLVIVTS